METLETKQLLGYTLEIFEISESDKEFDNPDNEDDDDIDEEGYYPDSLLENKKEELISAMIDDYDDGIQYMKEIYGDLDEYIKNNPDCVDTDSLIDNILSYDGFGNQLARYDGNEHEISYEDENGNTKFLYAYRVN